MHHSYTDLIVELIDIYAYCVVAWAVMQTLISIRLLSRNMALVNGIMMTLNKICGRNIRRCRKLVPKMGRLDLAPVVLLLLLGLLRTVILNNF